MQIEEFLAASLEQMIAGVKRAQSAAAAHGGVINPQVESAKPTTLDFRSGTLIQTVEFDLAVTASESQRTGGDAKAGIISVLSASIKAGSDSQLSTVSRIKFSIPVIFPRQLRPDPEDAAD